MDVILSDLPQIAFMALLLCLSGLFSGSETALFSLKKVDLNRIRGEAGAVNNAIVALHADQAEFLMTVLFCNMTVNILFFASSTVVASDIAEVYGASKGFLFGILCLLGVITFGEVTPKSLAAAAQLGFARVVALPMFFLHKAVTPVRIVLGGFVRAGERVVGVQPRSAYIDAEELRMLVEMSRNEGVLSSFEEEFIHGILELPEVRLGEIMTPRMDLITATLDDTVERVLNLAREHDHAKIPVRDPEADEIVGWVDAREMFVADATGPLRAFLKEPLYLSEFGRADQALALFRERHVRLAVVVDEWGGAAGVLTLSDIVSEIVGEIGDEEASVEEPIRVVGENEYRLAGDVSVREWRTLFRIADDLPRAATLSGLVVALLGRSARVGDRVRLGNLVMEVTALRKRRVDEIHLTLDAPGGEGEA